MKLKIGLIVLILSFAAFRLSSAAESKISVVKVNPGFLLSDKGGCQLMSANLESEFDLYLLLCKTFEEERSRNKKAPAELKVNFVKLAKQMGFIVADDLEHYNDKDEYCFNLIHRPLMKLELYGLVNYKRRKVSLETAELTVSNEKPIKIPIEYWELEYPRKLPMHAKYMYLVSLFEEGRNSEEEAWGRPIKALQGEYHLARNMITYGLDELNKRGILEIKGQGTGQPTFKLKNGDSHLFFMTKTEQK